MSTETNGSPTLNDVEREFVRNVISTRSQLFRNLIGSRRDYDEILDYPNRITVHNYETMYERMDIAHRVVDIYPDECWSVRPEVYESDDETEATEFEQAWQDLIEEKDIMYHLWRGDIQSRIGTYGVLLLGFEGDLKSPVPGVVGGRGRPSTRERELLYVRPFSESVLSVKRWEKNPNSPRFMFPSVYSIKMGGVGETQGVSTTEHLPFSEVDVHWTRIVHLADQRGSSQVFGTPALRPVYNRILDLRKTLGGSAEMFWKGAFPGYAFEVNPEFIAAAGLDNTDAGKEFKEEMRTEFFNFSEGLQRYLSLLGVTAKSLAPQAADPENHVQWQLRAIAMTIGVPMRVFMGSEEGSLASSQDTRIWHKKVKMRQNNYLSPFIVRPFVQRLVDANVLPTPENGFKIHWPDLDVLSEQDNADVADLLTTALQKYQTSGIANIMAPEDYLIRVLGFDRREADKILANADEFRPEFEAREERHRDLITRAGGGDNMNGNNPAASQNPRRPGRDRSRSPGSASRNT